MSDTIINGLTIHDHGQQVDSDEDKARKDLEARYGAGHVYSTEELRDNFMVVGFAAPFVVVERRDDGARGSLEFTHSPRFYFNFVPDRK